MLKQVFMNKNVLSAAQERIRNIFDAYDTVSVSVSGGKDSTVLAHLIVKEAQRRNAKIKMFFLDEEVDYENTIAQIKYLMFEMAPGYVTPVWFQFPFRLTNATSLLESQLVAWEEGKDDLWMRAKDPRSIQKYPYSTDKIRIKNKIKGFGFHDAIYAYEANQKNTCFCIGIRAAESPTRWRIVSRSPGRQDWNWTTKRKNNCLVAYPIYDWSFSDIWKYIHQEKLRYNKIYDWMYKKGVHTQEMRISSLIHEGSFRALMEMPEFEPSTYNRLIQRIRGIATANIYSKSDVMMQCRKLPAAYKNWREYRDFLLATYPDKSKIDIFKKRFAQQLDNNYVARQQCRQLMLNDYENNISIRNIADPREATRAKWRNLL